MIDVWVCECHSDILLTEQEIEDLQKKHFCSGGGTIHETCEQCQWLTGNLRVDEETAKKWLNGPFVDP